MAAVQAVEDASRIPSHRMPGVRVQHLRELAQQTETRKEDRRAAVIRKAREDVGLAPHQRQNQLQLALRVRL